jgi:hypothetical protein
MTKVREIKAAGSLIGITYLYNLLIGSFKKIG